MCGIIGYVGFREANAVLLDALKRLEYRGYDSAGIATIDAHLHIHKEVGNVEHLIPHQDTLKGNIGIGHTRWATHGAVTKENAHPQLSSNKKIAVIHNGIIENFKTLREQLMRRGYMFSSETDTEVIAHLIEEVYKGCLEDAVHAALQEIQGSYALVVLCLDEPDKIVGARKESPLIIGVGDNENFIASDIPALLKYTNRVMYLDDGELCAITKTSITVLDKNKQPVHKDEQLIKWDIKDAEKSGFAHFMLKEIYDQPNSINQALRGRVSEIDRQILFADAVERIFSEKIDSIQIIACGTSFYAGLVGKYIIEQLTGLPVIVDIASEYRFFGPTTASSLVIAVTQSGETTDTLAALKHAKAAGSKTLVITNAIGSSATRLADGYILTQSGLEVGVAATKTFTSQLVILLLIALKLGSLHSTLSADELYHLLLHTKDLPKQVRSILNKNSDILNIARELKNATSVFFIGRGVNYPLCLEGALKLKEISYVHAEGFAAGELKHGPFALLTEMTPVVAVVSKDFTYAKMLSNIGEVKARGPQVIAIADTDDTDIEKFADYVLRFPSGPNLLSCIPIAVILQLLAYHVANLKKCPIDKPRNLAKSVTVE